jgi:hypothetical protein
VAKVGSSELLDDAAPLLHLLEAETASKKPSPKYKDSFYVI